MLVFLHNTVHNHAYRAKSESYEKYMYGNAVAMPVLILRRLLLTIKSTDSGVNGTSLYIIWGIRVSLNIAERYCIPMLFPIVSCLAVLCIGYIQNTFYFKQLIINDQHQFSKF